METRKYLLEQIGICRRKLNLAKLLDYGALYAAAGGVAGIFFEFISLIRPFYYADAAAAGCFGAGLLAGICRGIVKRADMKQAAGKLDSFGLQERMLTAYENRDREDKISALQRQNAFDCFEQMKERIKIPIIPDKRRILALLVSAAAVIGMSFLPSEARNQADLRHQVKEQAKEEKEELEAFLEALEGVDMESLTEEQKAKLKELIDTMELSREELDRADSGESLAAATQRLDYKYGQAAQSLGQIAGETAHLEAAGIAVAEAFAKAAANQNGQQTASSGMPSGGSGDGEGGTGEDGSGDGDGGDGKDGSGHSGGNGSGENEDQGGGNGSGENGNQGNGNGSGEGGQGSGTGDGSGGNGGGTGSGRGESHSDAAHDYVSVPDKMGDDSSLTGDKTGDQHSDYYRDQNGLAWEGEHVEYGSVIGEYADSAYEGIAGGKYPNGMETVIRDYFEQLNK